MPATIITRWGTSSNAAAKVQLFRETRKYFVEKLYLCTRNQLLWNN